MLFAFKCVFSKEDLIKDPGAVSIFVWSALGSLAGLEWLAAVGCALFLLSELFISQISISKI